MLGTKHIARVLGIATCAGCILGGVFAQAGTIDPGLQQVLSTKASDEVVSALVFLEDRVDLKSIDAQLRAESASPSARHETVLCALQDTAQTTQAALRDYLGARQRVGRVCRFKPFWLVNAFRVDAPASEIEQLAQRSDVDRIYFNFPIACSTPVEVAGDAPAPRSPEPGLVAINAPAVWEMGITGAGVVVATIDSGVAGNHLALASRWAAVADPRYAGHPEWAWYDSLFGQPFPHDDYGHGTHTMGTICGGPPGDSIGVAPGAVWISAYNNAYCTTQFADNSICCLQWMADPDGDPSTFWDVPAVCSNSWGLAEYDGYSPCDDLFWTFIDACEAAGVVVLFSAGNDGADGPGRPADRAADNYSVCAIGAVDADAPGWPLAPFSATGPTWCTPTGDPAVKPELVAPGVDVRSSYPDGSYVLMSGTSMASPHVAGVVALMRQACPYLTVQEVKRILYGTAIDLGPPGEDNEYGWGMIDALAAVNRALEVCSPRAPHAWDATHSTAVNASLTIFLRATDDRAPEPPAALTYVITALPANGDLRDPGAAIINSVPYALAGGGNEVIYDPGPYFQGHDSFAFIANDGGLPPHGGDSNTGTISLTVGPAAVLHFEPLDANPGWSSEGEWAFGQPTGQGGAGGGSPDPTSGVTGPNVYGVNLNGDYSGRPGGPYYLTTPPLDFTEATEVSLKFYRWLNTKGSTWARVMIEVSTDGVAWTEIWPNDMLAYMDNQWRLHEYDISGLADHQPCVYVRWGYQTFPGSGPMSGWNIDDIQFWGVVPPAWKPGDLDGDADVDLDDFGLFAGCLAGPSVPVADDCEKASLDSDTDCDLADFADFQECLAGSQT